MVFIKILIMFFASLFFPILTLLLYLLSSDTDDRFRKFWKLFVATMFIILLLSCLLATIPSMSVFSELILKVFSNFNTIVIYGSVILLIPQALLYSKWYTTKRGDTAQYCWSWLKYCATLIFFWYFLPFFLSLIGFKVSLLELTVGIPILVTAIYMFLVERPPQTKKRNIIDKILGNVYVNIFMFLFSVINSAVLWYFILLGKTPQTLISLGFSSIIGWISWYRGSTR